MKKNFLTFMLFFAFLMVSVQSVSAQTYVTEPEALILVQSEIQTIQSNTINQSTQQKNATYAGLQSKLEFLQVIEIRLQDGESVTDAITHGVQQAGVADYVEAPSTPKGVTYRTPLHQEIVDLLSL